MTQRLIVDGGEVTGHLRKGIEERVFESKTGHVHGKRIRIKEVVVIYDLEDGRCSRPLGLSENVRIFPREEMGSSGYLMNIPED